MSQSNFNDHQNDSLRSLKKELGPFESPSSISRSKIQLGKRPIWKKNLGIKHLNRVADENRNEKRDKSEEKVEVRIYSSAVTSVV